MSDEKLGYEAHVEVEQATQALGQMERSVRSLLAAMEEISSKGGAVPVVNTSAAQDSMLTMQRSFDALRTSGVTMANGIGEAMGQMSDDVARHMRAMSQAAVGDLQEIERQLLATRTLMEELGRQQVRAGFSVAHAGGAGATPHQAPHMGPVVAAMPAFHNLPPGSFALPLAGLTSPASLQPHMTSIPGMQSGAMPRFFGAGMGGAAAAMPFAFHAPGGAPPAAGVSVGLPSSAGPIPVHIASGSTPVHVQIVGSIPLPLHGGGGGGGGGGGAPPNTPPATKPGLLQGFQMAGNALAGMAGAIGLGGLVGGAVAYAVDSVRRVSEEYVRVANDSPRLSGGRSATGMRDSMLAAGAPFYFSRDESLSFGEQLGTSMGRNRGVSSRDISAGLAFTRGMGLEVGETAQFFGQAGQKGEFRDGDLKRFSGEIATSIQRSNMMGRASEAMQAASEVMGEMASRVGDLTDAQRTGVLAVQEKLAQGPEMFRGMQGARMMQGLGHDIAPGGGNEVSNTLIDLALLRKNPKMDPYELMMRRDEGATPENLKAVFGMMNERLGPNASRHDKDYFIKQAFPSLGYIQADTLGQVTSRHDSKGRVIPGTEFTDSGSRARIKDVVGEGLKQQHLAAGGGADMVRKIALDSENLHHVIGEKLFGIFKTFQEKMLEVGSWSVNFATKTLPGVMAQMVGFGSGIADHAQGMWKAISAGALDFSGMVGGALKGAREAIEKFIKQYFGDNPIATVLGHQADALDKAGGVENQAKAMALRAAAGLMTVDGQGDESGGRGIEGMGDRVVNALGDIPGVGRVVGSAYDFGYEGTQAQNLGEPGYEVEGGLGGPANGPLGRLWKRLTGKQNLDRVGVAGLGGAAGAPVMDLAPTGDFGAITRANRELARANAHGHHGHRGAMASAHDITSADINGPDFHPGQLVTAGKAMFVDQVGQYGANGKQNSVNRGYGDQAVLAHIARWNAARHKWVATSENIVFGHLDKVIQGLRAGSFIAPGSGIGYAQGGPSLPGNGMSEGPHVHITVNHPDEKGLRHPEAGLFGLGSTYRDRNGAIHQIPGLSPRHAPPPSPHLPPAHHPIRGRGKDSLGGVHVSAFPSIKIDMHFHGKVESNMVGAAVHGAAKQAFQAAAARQRDMLTTG